MKERLDILLVNKGLAPSREKAKALIMSGIVYVDGQKEDKPGSVFDEEKTVEVKGSTLKYVSRGGLKLEKAMEVWPITLTGCTCMDIGASTGGFTDCMLQNGAVLVYAVDSGRGQLDWKLRQDERVICMEKTNARYLDHELIPEPIDFFSVDVSFISLSKILPPAYELLKEGGQAVCLIKPQFEAGREKVGKKGVVRDRKVHVEVIDSVLTCAQAMGFTTLGLDYSPIKGPEGNIEYLVWLGKGCERPAEAPYIPTSEQITVKAHEAL
ncbi:MAG: TlyA family RNA methyltransferase [Lachnospiraceae bacterium]